MSHTEFDREIPPEEQLRDVSLILLEALLRIHRHGPPPRPPKPPAKPPAPTPSVPGVPRRKRSLPKARHAKPKPGTYKNRLKNLFKKRTPQKTRFWMEKVVSIEDIPCDEVARAVCHTHQPLLEFELRDAFDYFMGTLSPDERRLVDLVAERGITDAARELGTTWRQIEKVLACMRSVLEKAGLGPADCRNPVVARVRSVSPQVLLR